MGPTEPPRVPAVIALVSGNHQEGKVGGWTLDEPFAVRVTDPLGDGVYGVRVAWRVASGAGELADDLVVPGVTSGNGSDGRLFTTTSFTGLTRVRFRPTVLGTSTVTAEVDGIQGSPVVFTAQARSLVIGFGPSRDCLAALIGSRHSDFLPGDPDGSFFRGPDGSSDVSVTVGTTVEWSGPGTEWMEWLTGPLPATCSQDARIVSTREPAGGEPFDSGILGPDDTFEFTPGVAGRWEYVDEISGETGTLTTR